MSETRTKPSEQALQAARALQSATFVGTDAEEELQAAEIIDAEHRELRECLRDCCVQIAAALNHPTAKGLSSTWRDSAFALKKRAERLLRGDQ